MTGIKHLWPRTRTRRRAFVRSQRVAALAAVLGVLAALLGAAASIVDKRESLRWLWLLLTVLGAVVGVPAALFASPWWQNRQQARLEQERIRLARERMAQGHFVPRGRGIAPFSNRQGWYFTGRTRVLQALVKWLTTPPGSDLKARLVTGRPGSGKSAVLGRLITLSDPNYRAEALRASAASGAIPPQGCIDICVNARDMTVGEVVTMIAEAAGIEATSPDDLFLGLQDRHRPLVVVVDAVDEAAEPTELASKLLEPLAAAASSWETRLLVGARPRLRDRLGASFEVLDLDDPAYLDSADLVEYVRRCLLLEGDPGVWTPYRGQPVLAEPVAQAVAARAQTSFLIAWLVAQSLIAADKVEHVRLPDGQEQFPAEVGPAMRRYLDQFKADRAKVRDLLVALAFAEGDGLADDELWAALATRLGTARYRPRDIRWMLQDTAVSDLLEPGQVNGKPSYRLFHAALIEYLQTDESRRPDVELRQHLTQVQSAITEELLRRVPVGPDGGKDWLSADLYVRMHLATHAAAAGRLDEVASDPQFLLAAEPSRLLRALPSLTEPAAKQAARVFRGSLHHLRTRPADEHASYLELTARQFGLDEFADRVGASFASRPWQPLWANWRSSSQARAVIGRAPGRIHAVALSEVDSRPVVVAGGSDGRVRTWDLEGVQVSGTPGDNSNMVWSIATGTVRGRSVAACGYNDGSVRVWDLANGAEVIQIPAAHPKFVRAVALGELDGRAMVASGGWDGAIRLWDLLDGRQLGEPLFAYPGTVESVAIEMVLGRISIISCGDSLGQQPSKLIRIWDLAERSASYDLPTGTYGLIRSCAHARLLDREILISGGSDGIIRVWDLEDRREVREIPGDAYWIHALALLEPDKPGETPIILSGGDATLRLWNITDGTPIGKGLVGHDANITCLDVGRFSEGTLVVSGSDDGTVRTWILSEGGYATESSHAGHDGEVTAAALRRPPGQETVVSCGFDSTIRRWHLLDGTRAGQPLNHESDGWGARAVAVGNGDGRWLLAAGGGDRVGLWDLDSGEQLQTFTGHTGTIRGVAIGNRQGQPIVVSASTDYTIRLWDPNTGTQLGDELRTGYEKSVEAITVTCWSDRSLLVSGGGDRDITIWDLESGRRIGNRSKAMTTISAPLRWDR